MLKIYLNSIALLCLMGPRLVMGQEYEATVGIPMQLGQFRDAKGIAIDPAGNIFVGDAETNTITKFDSNGNPLFKFGGRGTGNGQFIFPSGPRSGTNYLIGLTTNSAGELFVPDFENNRVQKFSNAGVFISSFGSTGSANGEFFQPSAVALDANGNIFVSERGNHRVQKFSSTGTFITKWGVSGTGDGAFGEYGGASGIAVDDQGNVYVADGSGGRIQKFDNNGNFILKFGAPGTGDGEFITDYGYLGIVSDGTTIYVADPLKRKIQSFSALGVFQSKWGVSGNGSGEFLHPLGLAVDANDNLLVVDGYSFCVPCLDNNRIQKFTSDGNFISGFGGHVSLDGQLSYPHGVVIDHVGNIYVTDRNNHRIQKFNPTGTFQKKWGSFGAGAGEFFYPQGIAIDKADRIYVVDMVNFRVQKFDGNGNLIRQFGNYGQTGDGNLFYPEGIAVDGNANVYIADTGNDQIQKFDSTGVFITRWGSHGTRPGTFESPQSITVDGNGFVYVTDNTRIQKFNSSGLFVTSWNVAQGPVTATSSGMIMKIESETGLVKLFLPSGSLTNTWGGNGSGNLQFNQPSGVTIFENRYLYVADSRNHRVQKHKPTITFDSFSDKTYGDEPVLLNASSTFGADVTYTSSDPGVASITGAQVTIHNAGSTLITAIDIYDAASPVGQTLLINKASLVAMADDKIRMVGDSNPLFTISYSGFKNSETSSVLDILPVAATTATTGSPAGTYEITVSGGSDNNYTFSYTNGTLTIEGLVTSIIEASNPISLSIFPNPAIQELRVKVAGVSEDQVSKLVVYDLTGKLVDQQDFNGSNTSLVVSNYPVGQYLIRVYSGQIVHNVKLIKQ